MLPSLIPNARIWAFCYNSNWLGEAPIQNLESLGDHLLTLIHQKRSEHSRAKPLVFVAHSFGGIVLAKALTSKTMSTKKYAYILQVTIGAVFLGTPFRGSAAVNHALFIANAAKALGYNSCKTLLESLLPSSEGLANLLLEFSKLAVEQNLQIISFYEQFPMPILREAGYGFGWLSRSTTALIVPKSQAVLEAHEVQALGTTHTKMNEFSGPNDNNYKLVTSQILEIAGHSSQILQKKQQHSKKKALFTVPYYRNPDFIGRSDVLQDLDRHLGQSRKRVADGDMKTKRKRAALCGLGGIGKSQIAIEYAYLRRDRFPDHSIFWVHAASMVRFEQSYLEIATAAGLELQTGQTNENMLLVKRWLESEESGEWLLVVDNADDQSLFLRDRTAETTAPVLKDFIPERSTDSILYTSRDRAVCLSLTSVPCTIILDKMETKDCTELVRTLLTTERYQLEEATRLVTLMDNLPLALAQAAAYIEQNQMAISQYLKLFHGTDGTQSELLKKEFEAEGRDYAASNAISRTWKISFKQIQDQRPLAAQLLSVMSFLERQDIPKSILQRLYHREFDLEESLGTLQSFSFIKAAASADAFDVHGLVQVCMRNWLNEVGKSSDIIAKAVNAVSDEFPGFEFEYWRVCARYLPHSETVLKHSILLKVEIEKESLLLHNVGTYLVEQGESKTGEIYLKRSLKIDEVSKGAEHPDTLMSMHNLALTYSDQRRYAEAEKLLTQVLETRKRVLRDDHPGTLMSMHNLASIYSDQRRYAEAEKLLTQVLETRKRVLGDDHPDTLISMHKLASTYSGQGRYAEAEKLLTQVLETRKRVLGDDHPGTLSSMHKLASIYSDQRRYAEAEELGMQVLATQRRVLGVEHPSTLATMQVLATTYWQQGRHEQAAKLEVRALEMTRRIQGEKHPDTLICMNNLAFTWWSIGRNEEALELMTQASVLAVEKLGLNHPSTQDYMFQVEKWR
jgi:tetratricopeptide (TPR) repeat protein